MGTLFDHLKSLFDYELYSNAKTLVSTYFFIVRITFT